MRKLLFIYTILFILISISSFAQTNSVGIGTLTPDPSALLDINGNQSNNKGLLIPRLTALQRIAINSPANSLLVFDTDSSCFFYWSSAATAWKSLCGLNQSVGAGVTGNTGSTGVAGTNGVIGSTGHTGASGATGTAGTNGVTGASGTAGINGFTGSMGPTGTAGITGATGPGTICNTAAANYVTKFTSPTDMCNSSIYDNGSNVGINTNSAPDGSAKLDITSTNMGVLVPRLTTTQRNAIASPAHSLLIFNTTTNCYEWWDSIGNAWVNMSCGAACSTSPASVVAAATANPVCESATANLTGNATGAATWSWTGPNGFTSAQQNPSITAITLAGAGTYTLTASNSCGSSAPVTVTLAVTALPSTVTASASPNPICPGTTLTLTGSATGATTWAWTGPNGFTSSSQSPTISNTTSAEAGAYTLTASNACGSAAPVSTSSVVVSSTLAAPVAGANTPSATQIVWNWNTVSGAAGYQWSTSSTYPGVGVNVLATPTYTQTGLTCNTAYTLYVWAYNSCENSVATTLTQTTASCCVSNVGAACDKGTSQLQPGCDDNYGCASFVGIYYGNVPGDCNGANSDSFVEYTGPTCTYIGYAYYDPFHYPQPPNGSCFDSSGAGYAIEDSYTKVVPTTGCTHYVHVPDMTGITQCNGSCQ
ncbi:MAG: hypothetical protein V4608_09795 [Bacteroidota bacterium]